MKSVFKLVGVKSFGVGLGFVAACLASSVGGANSASAANFVVNSLADTDGASCGADCTLRQAINASNGAAGSDTITFSVQGTIRLTRDLPFLESELTIRNTQSATVTVSGDVNNNRTQDAGDVRVFAVTNRGNVIIDRLIISGGFASASGNAGGGINNDGNLMITNSTVSGNKAGFGGGIYSIGTLTVKDCTFIGNGAQFFGGAINTTETGKTTIDQSKFSGNSARNGGGVHNSGTTSLSDSTLLGNQATQGGGALSNFILVEGKTSTMILNNVSVLENSSVVGGGGISNASVMRIAASRIDGNRTSGGGGLSNTGSLTIASSAIRGNVADNGAGGGISGGGAIEISTSTIQGNVSRRGGGISYGATSWDGPTAKLTITDSAILDNSCSTYGGGINLNSTSDFKGVVQLRQCTFSGNNAELSGGALANLGGRTAIESCTITANKAPADGAAGIYSSNRNGPAITQVRNSIIASNAGSAPDLQLKTERTDSSNLFISGGYNLIGSGGTEFFKQPGDRVNINDAKLGPLVDSNGPTPVHLPALDSLAINGGDPTVAAAANMFDQRGTGFARVRAGRIDIGSAERQIEASDIPLSATDDNYELILGPTGQAQQAGVTLQSNGIFFISAPGILANDSNPENASVTVRLARSPMNGRIQVRADGSFFYLPNAGFAGIDEFFYTLSNGQTSSLGRVRLPVFDRRAPELRFDTPPNGATLKAVTRIAGRVRDKQSGIKSVTLLWQRFDGAYWNGSAWTSDAVELPLVVQGINWAYNGSLPTPGTDNARSLLDGSYELTATATDNSGNINQATNRITIKNPPTASTVRFSSATASATQGAIVLNFTGALDAAPAGDKANFRVAVKGVVVPINTATYSNNSVTLGNFNLSADDKVTVQIGNLRDATGKTIAGGTIQLVAR